MDHRHQNVTIKTKKHIEENVQENLCYCGLGKVFLDRTTDVQTTKKKKADKLDCIEIKNFVLIKTILRD